ncbi:MAG: YwaF family protein [Clostridia bacterium]|nr:YwaF family protein [Clostridia bacterium]
MTYHFFDYKYNIEGYNGQHYGSAYQTFYLIATVVIAFALAFLLRKVKKETVKKSVGIIGIALTALYIIKTIWESHYDVATDRGFNTSLLPFDTCSIIMWAALIYGFCDGFFADWAKKWIVSLGFAGGFANALFLQGLRYYPFFTFGAFYSMIWHAAMIFLAWWLLLSGDVRPKFSDTLRACGFHAVFSVLPIAINFSVSHMNWMLYDDAGGVPIIEELCKPYANTPIATVIMALAYVLITFLLFCVYIFISFISKKVKTLFCKTAN